MGEVEDLRDQEQGQRFALPPDEAGDGKATVPLGALLARKVGFLPLRTWLLGVSAMVFAAVLFVAREQLPSQREQVRVTKVAMTPVQKSRPKPQEAYAQATLASANRAAVALFESDLRKAEELYSALAQDDARFEPFARILKRKLRAGCDPAGACLPIVNGAGR